LPQPGAGLVEDHGIGHIHGVAGKRQSIGFLNRHKHRQADGLCQADAGLDQTVGVKINGGRVIEQPAVTERAKQVSR
jgi:hypothetical protein